MKEMLSRSASALRELWVNNVRLTKLAWESHKKAVVAVLVVSFAIAIIPFLRSGMSALLINELIENIGKSMSSHLVVLISAVIVVSVVPEVIYGWKGYIDRRFWISMEQKFQLLFFEKKGAIDIAAYEDPKFNDLVQKAEERSIYPILDLIESQFTNSQNVIGVVVAAAILLAFDWRIFLLVLTASIPKFVVELRYGRGVWGILDSKAEDRRRFFDLKSHFHRLTDLTELKLFQNVGHFRTIISELLENFNDAQRRIERKKLISKLISVLISSISIGVSTAMVVLAVIRGDIEVGTMVFVLSSMGGLQNALSGFLGSIARQYEHSLFVTDLFKVMDTKPVIMQVESPVRFTGDRAAKIVFENVSFAYPGTQKPVLEDISLTIPAGSRLALVGENGAGKTTLVKLLCRFYDPTFGRILVNGRDLREINLEDWHRALGTLFQDFATYRFPVKDVIAMGRRISGEKPSMEKVMQAAQMSGADTFIEKWSGKYEQVVGKQFTGGIDPSKGQLQKLALARLFYRNPRVMILDEPTASIDAEAEAAIFERIEAMNGNRTVVLISHRFSTVRSADQICVIKGGKIAELGTHDELMQKEETYARLFNLQAKGYES